MLCVSSVGFHSSWLPRRSVSRTFLNRLPLLSVRDCCSPAKVDTMSEDEVMDEYDALSEENLKKNGLLDMKSNDPEKRFYH